MKQLTKKNKEFQNDFEHRSMLAELLPDLYLWESYDFTNWTISELIEFVNKTIREGKQ